MIEFKNCTFLQNTAFLYLFDIFYTFHVSFEKCVFFNNTSSLFGIDHVNLSLIDSYIYEHICDRNNYIEGCLITSNQYS